MASRQSGRSELDQIVSAQRRRRGLVIVVSAPSGAGKTTICGRLVAAMPEMRLSISFTTRPPRKGERNGRHYYFVTREKFEEERDRGRFLEWAEVHGHLYATPRGFIEKQIETGKDTVLDIDVQGARAIKEAIREAVLIFLLPPSLAELKKRLKGRSSDSDRDINTRFRKATAELGCYPLYDYLVVNEDLDEAVNGIKAIIAAESRRAGRVIAKLSRTPR